MPATLSADWPLPMPEAAPITSITLVTPVARAGTYVHYGASTSAVESWTNFDASPTVRVQNLPVVGRVLAKLSGNHFSFPDYLKYGDIVKGLPITDRSADAVYASHVLEHLAVEDMRRALANTLRMLKPGGVFRLIVPDLRERARRYVELTERDPDNYDAANAFMQSTDLGDMRARVGFIRTFRRAIGFGRHEWMWDRASMQRELEIAGFSQIRTTAFGDATDPMFAKVEQLDRYFTGDIAEVGMEAVRPL